MRYMTLTDFWYSLFSGVAMNVALSDLDINCQGHKFEKLVSRKRWDLAQIFVSNDFYRGTKRSYSKVKRDPCVAHEVRRWCGRTLGQSLAADDEWRNFDGQWPSLSVDVDVLLRSSWPSLTAVVLTAYRSLRGGRSFVGHRDVVVTQRNSSVSFQTPEVQLPVGFRDKPGENKVSRPSSTLLVSLCWLLGGLAVKSIVPLSW